MQKLDHDEVTIHIDAPPERVYALLADVTHMPDFSPEIKQSAWILPAVGAYVGTRSKPPTGCHEAVELP